MADLLVVDDDDDLRAIFVDLLELEGHHVRSACNGRDALALLTDRAPELIILDVEMPILTGPGMAYELFLHDAGLEEIPIILTSGVKDLDEVARIVGTEYYLSKPFEVSAFLRVLSEALSKRSPPSPQVSRLASFASLRG